MRSGQSAAFLALVCSLLLAPAGAEDEPRGWLDRMGYALEYLNYEGTLVQLRGTDAAVMHVVHRVDGGVPTERITALDEVGREIIRKGDDTTCILPDQQAVLLDERVPGMQGASPLREHFSTGLHIDDRYYRLAIASGGKLVGRDTHLITVQPTDSYRYGYRLWLDHATAMPLKVQIADNDGVVVEQLLFSAINLPERIPAADVQPSIPTDTFTWRRSSAAAGQAIAPNAGASAWRVTALPPGFSLRAIRAQRSAANEGPLSQFVYSDGVASVSVFVEDGVAAAEQGEGPSHVGAANAYTTVNGGYLITAVGEVPVRTVELIARSVRPLDSAGR